MNKIKISENSLTDLIYQIIKEEYGDVQLFNKNKTYVFNFDEIYQLVNDLRKVENLLISNSELFNNKPELNDRINRLKRSVKLLNKKMN